MGAVYESRDLLLQSTVAVKVLEHLRAYAPNALEELRREVLISRRVTHPNVARVFEFFQGGSGPFLTMEFLDGETLAQRQLREPAMSASEALALLGQVSTGLEAIHAQGIVHRDLKPSNIILVQADQTLRVVVTDFGIAHAEPSRLRHEQWAKTQTGFVAGTPRYMAPEQLRGEAVSPRTDVFALGVVASDVFGAGQQSSGPRRQSRALERTLQRAVADNPLERQATPHELIASLERALRPPLGRHRRLALALATAIVLIVAFASLRRSGTRVATSPSGPAGLATTKGKRLYAQGIERLRNLDFVGARDLLEGALATEQDSALARQALGRAWWNLGYSSKARVLAREAWDGTDTSLVVEKMRAEGLYRKVTGDLPRAEELFERVFKQSASLEDGLDLASVEPARKAFDTLQAMRVSTGGSVVDPRLELALADAAVHSGRFADASEAARKVEARARAENSPFLVAAALRANARVIFEMDRPTEPAFVALDEAAAILRDAGNLGAVADIECEKAQVLAALGTEEQYAESRKHFQKAISLFRRQGNTERAHWWLTSIAMLVLSRGEVSEAISLFREAKEEIDGSGEQPDPSFWAAAGWAALIAGDLGRARSDLARFHSTTDAWQVMPRPMGVEFEAELLREEDRLAEAHQLLETWLARGESSGTRVIITDVPVRLARIESDLGRPDRCLERLRRLERGEHSLGPLFARFQNPIEGICLLQKGDSSGARQLAERGWAAASASSFFTWRILNGLVLARADAAEGHRAEATSRAQELLAEARAHGHVPAVFESQLALGQFEAAAGEARTGSTFAELEREAKEKGFLRIARLARQAQGQGKGRLRK
jgi:tetratricopeptide (TPR) repeat protein